MIFDFSPFEVVTEGFVNGNNGRQPERAVVDMKRSLPPAVAIEKSKGQSAPK